MAEAHVQQDDIALIETELLAESVYRRFGVDFRGYERHALAARLLEFCASHSIANISALQGRVLREPELAHAALAHASRSPSDFMTSAIPFTAMRCAALPVLRSASWPAIWLAECEDAALVIQMAAMLDQEGLLGKTQLFVTHANEDVLHEVAQLQLDPAALTRCADQHARSGGECPLADYCEPHGDGMRLKAEFGRNIVWGQVDLASDASFMEFHAIVCQRPLRDLGHALQLRAFGLFGQSLCNFGILQVEPPVGVAPSELPVSFLSLLPEQGIYRRSPSSG